MEFPDHLEAKNFPYPIPPSDRVPRIILFLLGSLPSYLIFSVTNWGKAEISC